MFITESAGRIFFGIGEYLAKLQVRTWLFRANCAPGHHTAELRRKCTTPTFLLVTSPNIFQFKKNAETQQ